MSVSASLYAYWGVFVAVAFVIFLMVQWRFLIAASLWRALCFEIEEMPRGQARAAIDEALADVAEPSKGAGILREKYAAPLANMRLARKLCRFGLPLLAVYLLAGKLFLFNG